MLLFMLFGRFREVCSWWANAAKWLVVFAVCWYAVSRTRAAAIRNRLKDGNELPVYSG